jgi:hypothetical protein
MRLPSLFRRINKLPAPEEVGPNLVAIGIDREVIDEGDAAPLARYMMAACGKDSNAVRAYREALDLVFESYDEDPREVWEIPAVVEFVHDLNARWPQAPFFLSKTGYGLQVMQFCLAGAKVQSRTKSPDGDSTVTYSSSALAEILANSWFPGINEKASVAQLTDAELSALTRRVERYLSSGPFTK